MATRQKSVFDQPVYSKRQAALYLGLNPATLNNWTSDGGMIETPDQDGISFNNLAEAHILKAMRRVHGLPMQRIKKALKELAHLRKTPHPLLDEAFETDGVDLCIREEAKVINLSKSRQQEFREFVALYLRRVQRDDAGQVTRLYPFIVSEEEGEPRSIAISPTVSFGKPVIAGTGISTEVIVGRFNSRDSVQDLSEEYQIDPRTLEDAIRWELNKGKAA